MHSLSESQDLYFQTSAQSTHAEKDKLRLNILSYNIQSGLPTERLSDYITRSWRHILPTSARLNNLRQISKLLVKFDVVALQEVDPGSLRSGYVNQVQYLAQQSGFPYWYLQLNRKLGRFAKFSNAVLSRYRPYEMSSHKLPGMIPGRGALRLFFGSPEDPLVIIIMHLALGPKARKQQLNYINSLIEDYRHVILMGDMNCPLEKLIQSPLLHGQRLRPVNLLYNTYPSWKPRRNIDHILVSPTVKVNSVQVLNLPFSDHLPIAIEVTVPYASSFDQKFIEQPLQKL